MRLISSVAETWSHFTMKHFSVCLHACVRFALWSPLMKADTTIVPSVLSFIFRRTRGDFHLPGFWLCLYARRLFFDSFIFSKWGHTLPRHLLYLLLNTSNPRRDTSTLMSACMKIPRVDLFCTVCCLNWLYILFLLQKYFPSRSTGAG